MWKNRKMCEAFSETVTMTGLAAALRPDAATDSFTCKCHRPQYFTQLFVRLLRLLATTSLLHPSSRFGKVLLCKERFRPGDLHPRSLHKCQSTRLLHQDRDGIIAKVHRSYARDRCGESLNCLIRGVFHSLHSVSYGLAHFVFGS